MKLNQYAFEAIRSMHYSLALQKEIMEPPVEN